MKNTLLYVSSVFLFMMFITGSFANAQQISYHGRIIDTVTNLGLNGLVEFRVQVRTPSTSAANCLMYEELVSRNVVNGVFVIGLNNGSGVVTPLNGYTLQQVFSNKNTFGAFNLTGNCVAGGPNYTPLATDSRRVSISFRALPTDPWEPLPTQTVAYVPAAIESLNVGGFSVDALMRVVDGSGNPFNVSPLNNTQYNELINTLTNNSSFYLKNTDPAVGFTGALGGDVTGTQAATTVARIRGVNVDLTGLAAGQVLSYNGTNFVPIADGGGTVTNVTSSNAYLTVATGTSTPVLTVNVGTVANTVAAGDDARITNSLQLGSAAGGDLAGTYPNPTVATVGGSTAAQINTSVGDTQAATAANTAGTLVKRDGSGNIAVGTVSAVNASLNNIYVYNAGNANYAQIRMANTVSGDYTLTLPTTLPVAGTILGTNGSGDLTWVNPSSIGVTNVTASAPLASSGGSTPNITISQADSTTNGYLTSVDWNTFNNKLSTTLATGQVWVGSAGSVATPQFLDSTNVRSTILPGLNAWFNVGAACPTGQALNYSVITDQVSCTAYSISSAQVTGALGYTPLTKTLATNQIFVGSASGDATAVPLSGDATIVSDGTLTIVNNAITTSKIADDAITNSKVLSGDLSWTKINPATRPTTIAGYGITDAILANAGGVETMQAGTLAARPAAGAGNLNRVYVATDTGEIYHSNGAAWTLIGSATGLGGTVTSVASGGAPITVGGTSTDPTISITQSTTATDGYLTSTDFTTFNNKLGTATAFSGDVTGNYSATSVNRIRGIAVSAAAPTNAQFLVYDGASQYVAQTLSGDVTMSNSGVVTLNNTAVTPGSNYTKFDVDAKGRVTSAGNLVSTDISTLYGYTPSTNALANGNIFVGVGGVATAVAPSGDVSSISGGNIQLATTGVTASSDYTKVTVDAKGRVTAAGYLASTDISTLYGYTPANGAASVSSLNGLVGALNIALGTAGTDYAVSAAGSTVTLNLPTASGTNRGALSSSDWTVFNDKLGTATNFSGDVTGNYNTIALVNTAVTPGSNYTKFDVDAKGRVTSAGNLVSTDISTLYGFTPGQVRSVASGSGSIISIGGTSADPTVGITRSSTTVDGYLASTDFTIFNNKLGTATNFSGDVTGNYNTIALNNTGVTASSDYTKVTVDAKGRVTSAGYLASTDISTLYGYTPLAPFGNQSANTIYAGPSSGGAAAPTFRTIASTDVSAVAFVNGGNSFAGTATLGTNDANTLNLKTNASTRMSILSDGKVGIGTTAPTSKLNIVNEAAGEYVLEVSDSDAAASGAAFKLQKSRGTFAAPTAVLSGDTLGAIDFWSRGASTYAESAAINITATENHSETARGSNIILKVTPNATITPVERLRINPEGGTQFSGQAWSAIQTDASATTTTWDANTGNVLKWTTNAASPSITINNMKAGAAYMLVIKGSGTGAISITCALSTGAITSTTPLYVPANAVRVAANGANSKTVYTLMADGENCLVTWITGY